MHAYVRDSVRLEQSSTEHTWLVCLKTFDTTPNQVADDFAVAQSTPLPECITGVEGDKVLSAALHTGAQSCVVLPCHVLSLPPQAASCCVSVRPS